MRGAILIDARDEPFKTWVAISAPRFLGFHPIGEGGSGLDVACGNGAAGSPQQAALPAGDGGFWLGHGTKPLAR
jgi:hypothetical protein